MCKREFTDGGNVPDRDRVAVRVEGHLRGEGIARVVGFDQLGGNEGKAFCRLAKSSPRRRSGGYWHFRNLNRDPYQRRPKDVERVEALGADSVTAFGEVVAAVQEGEGLLHSLIYDHYQGSGVESIERSLATLENILYEIRHGRGILHSLVYDAPTEQDVVLEVLEAGARLNSILAKIDAGEGTFGLMLNDPTLYEELKLLVGGAGRSRVVRTLIGIVGAEEE